MKVRKIICETPILPYFHDQPEISQQIISIHQINAGVCAKMERIAIIAKITAAATAATIIFLFITYLLFLSCLWNIFCKNIPPHATRSRRRPANTHKSL